MCLLDFFIDARVAWSSFVVDRVGLDSRKDSWFNCGAKLQTSQHVKERSSVKNDHKDCSVPAAKDKRPFRRREKVS